MRSGGNLERYPNGKPKRKYISNQTDQTALFEIGHFVPLPARCELKSDPTAYELRKVVTRRIQDQCRRDSALYAADPPCKRRENFLRLFNCSPYEHEAGGDAIPPNEEKT